MMFVWCVKSQCFTWNYFLFPLNYSEVEKKVHSLMRPKAAAYDGAGCKHLWCPPGLSSNMSQPLIHSEASAKWRRRFRNAEV